MSRPEQLASSLWRLCDVLRDDGITYHQYINELSYLLFLKMAHEAGADEALPSHCRWSALTSADGDHQFATYMKLLVDLGTEGEGVVRQIFAHPTSLLRSPASLRLLVDGINSLNWHDTARERFGDIYEELLKYSAEKRSGAGQYFTPRHLIESIVRVTKPSPGECIQDPALGTAGFLVAAHQHIRKSTGSSAATGRYVGVELVPDNYRLALMNTFIHEMRGEYFLGDSLSPLGQELPPADLILTNPPFGTKRGGGGPSRSDLPYQTSNKQVAFLQHIVLSLAAAGRAAVVVPDNVFFEDGAGARVRRDLLEKCNLHTILRLPAGIFYAAGVKTNVIFFNREGSTERLWIYDARSGVPPLTKRDRPLERAHFQEFEHCFGTDPWGRSPRKESDSTADRWRCFPIQEVARSGFKLDRLKWLADTNGEDDDPMVAVHKILYRLQVATEELEGLASMLEGSEGPQ